MSSIGGGSTVGQVGVQIVALNSQPAISSIKSYITSLNDLETVVKRVSATLNKGFGTGLGTQNIFGNIISQAQTFNGVIDQTTKKAQTSGRTISTAFQTIMQGSGIFSNVGASAQKAGAQFQNTANQFQMGGQKISDSFNRASMSQQNWAYAQERFNKSAMGSRGSFVAIEEKAKDATLAYDNFSSSSDQVAEGLNRQGSSFQNAMQKATPYISRMMGFGLTVGMATQAMDEAIGMQEALANSQAKVETLQRRMNEAIETYGKDSRQAESATRAHEDALNGLTYMQRNANFAQRDVTFFMLMMATSIMSTVLPALKDMGQYMNKIKGFAATAKAGLMPLISSVTDLTSSLKGLSKVSLANTVIGGGAIATGGLGIEGALPNFKKATKGIEDDIGRVGAAAAATMGGTVPLAFGKASDSVTTAANSFKSGMGNMLIQTNALDKGPLRQLPSSFSKLGLETGKTGTIISRFLPVVSKIAPILGPIGIALAVVTTGMMAYQNDALGIRSATEGFGKALGDLFPIFKPFGEGLQGIAGFLGLTGESAEETARHFENAAQGFADMGGLWHDTIAQLQASSEPMHQAIGNAFLLASDAVINFRSGFVGQLNMTMQTWSDFWTAIENRDYSGAVDIMVTAFSAIPEVIGAFFEGLHEMAVTQLDAMGTVFGLFRVEAGKIWNEIGVTIGDAFGTALEVVSGLVLEMGKRIAKGFEDIVGMAIAFGGYLVDALGLGPVLSVVSQWVSDTQRVINNLATGITVTGHDIWDKIISSSITQRVSNWVNSQILQPIQNTLKNNESQFLEPRETSTGIPKGFASQDANKALVQQTEDIQKQRQQKALGKPDFSKELQSLKYTGNPYAEGASEKIKLYQTAESLATNYPNLVKEYEEQTGFTLEQQAKQKVFENSRQFQQNNEEIIAKGGEPIGSAFKYESAEEERATKLRLAGQSDKYDISKGKVTGTSSTITGKPFVTPKSITEQEAGFGMLQLSQRPEAMKGSTLNITEGYADERPFAHAKYLQDEGQRSSYLSMMGIDDATFEKYVELEDQISQTDDATRSYMQLLQHAEGREVIAAEGTAKRRNELVMAQAAVLSATRYNDTYFQQLEAGLPQETARAQAVQDVRKALADQIVDLEYNTQTYESRQELMAAGTLQELAFKEGILEQKNALQQMTLETENSKGKFVQLGEQLKSGEMQIAAWNQGFYETSNAILQTTVALENQKGSLAAFAIGIKTGIVQANAFTAGQLGMIEAIQKNYEAVFESSGAFTIYAQAIAKGIPQSIAYAQAALDTAEAILRLKEEQAALAAQYDVLNRHTSMAQKMFNENNKAFMEAKVNVAELVSQMGTLTAAEYGTAEATKEMGELFGAKLPPQIKATGEELLNLMALSAQLPDAIMKATSELSDIFDGMVSDLAGAMRNSNDELNDSIDELADSLNIKFNDGVERSLKLNAGTELMSTMGQEMAALLVGAGEHMSAKDFQELGQSMADSIEEVFYDIPEQLRHVAEPFVSSLQELFNTPVKFGESGWNEWISEVMVSLQGLNGVSSGFGQTWQEVQNALATGNYDVAITGIAEITTGLYGLGETAVQVHNNLQSVINKVGELKNIDDVSKAEKEYYKQHGEVANLGGVYDEEGNLQEGTAVPMVQEDQFGNKTVAGIGIDETSGAGGAETQEIIQSLAQAQAALATFKAEFDTTMSGLLVTTQSTFATMIQIAGIGFQSIGATSSGGLLPIINGTFLTMQTAFAESFNIMIQVAGAGFLAIGATSSAGLLPVVLGTFTAMQTGMGTTLGLMIVTATAAFAAIGSSSFVIATEVTTNMNTARGNAAGVWSVMVRDAANATNNIAAATRNVLIAVNTNFGQAAQNGSDLFFAMATNIGRSMDSVVAATENVKVAISGIGTVAQGAANAVADLASELNALPNIEREIVYTIRYETVGSPPAGQAGLMLAAGTGGLSLPFPDKAIVGENGKELIIKSGRGRTESFIAKHMQPVNLDNKNLTVIPLERRNAENFYKKFPTLVNSILGGNPAGMKFEEGTFPIINNGTVVAGNGTSVSQGANGSTVTVNGLTLITNGQITEFQDAVDDFGDAVNNGSGNGSGTGTGGTGTNNGRAPGWGGGSYVPGMGNPACTGCHGSSGPTNGSGGSGSGGGTGGSGGTTQGQYNFEQNINGQKKFYRYNNGHVETNMSQDEINQHIPSKWHANNNSGGSGGAGNGGFGQGGSGYGSGNAGNGGSGYGGGTGSGSGTGSGGHGSGSGSGTGGSGAANGPQAENLELLTVKSTGIPVHYDFDSSVEMPKTKSGRYVANKTGANTHVEDWFIVPMKDKPDKWKVVDGKGRNVAVDFDTYHDAMDFVQFVRKEQLGAGQGSVYKDKTTGKTYTQYPSGELKEVNGYDSDMYSTNSNVKARPITSSGTGGNGNGSGGGSGGSGSDWSHIQTSGGSRWASDGQKGDPSTWKAVEMTDDKHKGKWKLINKDGKNVAAGFDSKEEAEQYKQDQINGHGSGSGSGSGAGNGHGSGSGSGTGSGSGSGGSGSSSNGSFGVSSGANPNTASGPITVSKDDKVHLWDGRSYTVSEWNKLSDRQRSFLAESDDVGIKSLPKDTYLEEDYSISRKKGTRTSYVNNTTWRTGPNAGEKSSAYDSNGNPIGSGIGNGGTGNDDIDDWDDDTPNNGQDNPNADTYRAPDNIQTSGSGKHWTGSDTSDPDTWKAVKMLNDNSKWKVVDANDKNIATNFTSEDAAGEYIAHHQLAKRRGSYTQPTKAGETLNIPAASGSGSGSGSGHGSGTGNGTGGNGHGSGSGTTGSGSTNDGFGQGGAGYGSGGTAGNGQNAGHGTGHGTTGSGVHQSQHVSQTGSGTQKYYQSSNGEVKTNMTPEEIAAMQAKYPWINFQNGTIGNGTGSNGLGDVFSKNYVLDPISAMLSKPLPRDRPFTSNTYDSMGIPLANEMFQHKPEWAFNILGNGNSGGNDGTGNGGGGSPFDKWAGIFAKLLESLIDWNRTWSTKTLDSKNMWSSLSRITTSNISRKI